MVILREQKAESLMPTEIGPTPDGGVLTFHIECRPSPTASRGPRHAVTIHPDWEVETPHDLEAERVAVAFGGYTSCLKLIEKSIPAFRMVLPILVRRELAPIQRDAHGDWHLSSDAQVAKCCRGRRFLSAAAAARHVRGAAHISRAFDAPQWQVASLLRATTQAWNPSPGELLSTPHLDRLLREEGGMAEL